MAADAEERPLPVFARLTLRRIFGLMGVAALGLFWFAPSANVVRKTALWIGEEVTDEPPLYIFARNYPEPRFAMLSALVIGLGTFGNLLGGTRDVPPDGVQRERAQS